jgi:hypothetical protein
MRSCFKLFLKKEKDMKNKYSPLPTPECDCFETFNTAEEVWFWFWTCINSRKLGSRRGEDCSALQRICEVNDIRIVVKKLYQKSFLNKDHIRTLAIFGKKMYPPNIRFGNSKKDTSLWNEAMDILSVPFKQKGIIA